MELTKEESAMLAGRHGYAAKKSMEILVALGEIYGARRMVPVSHAHMVGLLTHEGAAPFIQEMADRGAKFIIPATGNFVTFDLTQWKEMGIPQALFEEQMAILRAYEKMGAIINPTCTPYLIGYTPRLGEHVAWAESSAVIYANSVLGARTNREGGPVPVAAAITGRIPLCGYHLDKNRRGQVKVMVSADLHNATDYATLGYFTGEIVQEKSPVFFGIPAGVSNDQLKALGAALATSGAVTLFHVLGVTPEARTEREVFGAKKPAEHETVHFGQKELRQTATKLSTSLDERMQLVVTGCPHASIHEVKTIAELMSGKKVHPDVEFWIHCSSQVKTHAERAGYKKILDAAGVRFVCETCTVTMPAEFFAEKGYKTLATNSAKLAFYIPGLRGIAAHYGPIERCVEAAVSGIWR